LVNSSLFSTAHKSLDYLQQLLEKYIAVLPFTEVKYDLANKLGREYLRKRKLYREHHFLKNENFPNESNEKLYDVVEDEIIKAILIDMHEDILNSINNKSLFF
jgi:hypothetical protein